MTPSPPADLDLSRAKASEKGLYQVAIEPEDGPLQHGRAAFLAADAEDRQPASRSTTPRSPSTAACREHGHGLPTSPAVSAHLGAGKYRVEGVKFTMSGWWELRFAITAPAGSDNAVFNVML